MSEFLERAHKGCHQETFAGYSTWLGFNILGMEVAEGSYFFGIECDARKLSLGVHYLRENELEYYKCYAFENRSPEGTDVLHYVSLFYLVMCLFM